MELNILLWDVDYILMLATWNWRQLLDVGDRIKILMKSFE